MTKLNPEAARQDLTVRECVKLLGCTIGGLCGMADKEAVAAAIHWWNENFDATGVFEATREMERQMLNRMAKTV